MGFDVRRLLEILDANKRSKNGVGGVGATNTFSAQEDTPYQTAPIFKDDRSPKTEKVFRPLLTDDDEHLAESATTDETVVGEGVTSEMPNLGEANAPQLRPRLQDRVRQAQENYYDTLSAPIGKEKWWADLATIGAGITNNIFNPERQMPVQGFGKWKKDFAIQRAGAELAPLQQQADFELGQQVKQAQIGNIATDNQYQRDKLQIDADRKEQERKDKLRKAFYQRNKSFNPARATEAQKRELAEFGETAETVGNYDFTKPTFKRIGDSTYRWDDSTKSFVDTNLPKDAPNGFQEVVLKDPQTGEIFKLTTTREKAAQMVNQRIVAGMQIEAGNVRQDKELEYRRQRDGELNTFRQATLNLRNQELELRKQAQNSKDANEKVRLEQDADKIKLSRQRWRESIKTKVQKGELTQDDADYLLDGDSDDVSSVSGSAIGTLQ